MTGSWRCNTRHRTGNPYTTARDPVLIAGSTWPKDHVFLKRLAEDMPLLQLVLVPHETDPAQLRAIRRLFRSPLPVFYSEALQEKNPAPPRILVIDSVGLLSAFTGTPPFVM